MEAPNSKHQITNNGPIIKTQNFKKSRFGNLKLEFGACLEFGICDLGF